MTTKKPVAAQATSTDQAPVEQVGRRKKRVDLYALSPNQLALFDQEDTRS